MANDPRRKQKQKQKRQQKQRQAQRAQGTPFSKLRSGAGEIEACYINKHWEEDGVADVLALRRLPGGGRAFGAFLIDLMCLGLKDAWGRIDISLAEFRDMLGKTRQTVELISVPPQTAWRLVSGGVRWAQDNGFRLPPRYERWVSVLGNPADCASADTSDFGDEDGELIYVGRLDDLSRRLIGCTLEQFLARPDVHLAERTLDEENEQELNEYEEFMTDLAEEDDFELEEMLTSYRTKLLDKVRQFLFSKSIQPHPRLPDAIDLLTESVLQLNPPEDDEEEGEDAIDEATDRTGDNIARFLQMSTPENAEELKAASEQLSLFMQQFKSPEELTTHIGLEEPQE